MNLARRGMGGRASLLVFGLAVLSAGQAQTLLYWDGNGSGTVGGGTGNWNHSSTRWSTSPTGTTYQDWGVTSVNTAVFQNTAGLVTLTNTIVAGGITFGTTGYVITDGGDDSRTLTLVGGGVINTGAGNQTITANILGSVGLTKTGTGTLTLNGVHGYTGTTFVNEGTLTIDLGGIGNVRVEVAAGATFDTGPGNESIRSLAGAGSVTIGSSNLSLSDNTSTEFSGVISGIGGSLTKSGIGIFTLTGNNTYTGATTVSGGTLQIGNGGTSGSFASSGVSLAFGTRLEFNRSDTFSNSSAITGSGSVTKAGSGMLTLSGSNTYGGGTTITGGFVTSNSDFGNAGITLNGGGVQWATGSTVDLSNRFNPLGSNGGIFDTNGNNVTFAGVLTGSGGMTKLGAGTVTLSNANTYTGTTSIQGGALRLDATGSLSSLSAISFANAPGVTLELVGVSKTIGSLSGGGSLGGNIALGSTTLTINGTTETTYSGVISGTGGLIKIGPRGLTLGGANTYTGDTTINDGELRLGAHGALPSTTAVTLATTNGPMLDLNGFSQTIRSLAGGGAFSIVNIVSGSTLTIDGTESTTFSGSILNLGLESGLIKSGTSTLTLDGEYRGLGTVTIQGGTLRFGPNATTLFSAGAVVLANAPGATLDLAGSNQSISSLSGGGALGGNVSLGSGTLTLSSPLGSGAPLTFSGIISGTGGLTQMTGNVTFDGANTYTGATTINGGFLRLGRNSALPSSTTVTLTNAVLDLNGFSQSIASLAGSGTFGGVTLGSGTLTVDGTASTTFSSVISGTGGLTKSGTSTLTLSGTNTYTGNTSIHGGILRLGKSSALSSSTVVTFDNTASAALDLNGFNNAIGPLVGGGPLGGNVTLGGGTLTVNSTAASTYSGAISGTGGLTKAGGSTLTLDGANAYTGATLINGGTLRLGTNGVLATATGVTFANATGALLDLNGFSHSVASLAGGGTSGGNVALGSATLTVSGTASTTYSGVISGTGGLIKSGTSTLTLSGTNTYLGDTTINGGLLHLGKNAALPNTTHVTLANTTGAALGLNGFDQSIVSLAGGGANGGNVTLGSGNLTVAGPASTTYSGVISGTGGLSKIGTGTLTLGGINTYTGTSGVEAGTLRLGANGALATSAAVVFSNTNNALLDLNGFSQTVASLAGGGANGGNITLGSGTPGALTVNNSSPVTYSGAISGNGSLIKSGTAALTLMGASTYTGSTTVNAGVLRIGATGVLPFGTALTLANVAGATFDLNGFTQPLASLSGGGTVGGNVTLGNALLSISGPASTTYSGVISGSGALVKTGSGTQQLLGLNTYTGATSVFGGTLSVNTLANLGVSSSLGAPTGADGILRFVNDSRLAFSSSTSQSTNRPISLAGSSLTLESNGAASITFTGLVTADPLGTRTLFLAGSSPANNTLASMIDDQGVLNVTKTGAGTWVLSGSNNYKGTTSITGGVLSVGSIGVVGLPGPLGAPATAAAGTIKLGAGTLLYSGGGEVTDRVIDLTDSGTLSANGSGPLHFSSSFTATAATDKTLTLAGSSAAANTIAGAIVNNSGSNTTALAKTGSGTWILSGANTYTGGTTISAGILQVGNGGTSGSLSPTGGIVNNAALVFNRSNAVTVANVISGNGSVTKIGPNTLSLTGANSYSGGTNVLAGFLEFATAANIGTGGVTLNGGGLRWANGSSLDVSNRLNALGGAGAVLDTNGNHVTLTTGFSGTGALTKFGTGTLVLAASNSYAGGTTVEAGTLQIGAGGTAGALPGNLAVKAGAMASFNRSDATAYADTISGAGSVNQQGAGELQLSGVNTYTGGTTFSAGTVAIGNNSALGTGPVAFSGGTLRALGGPRTLANAFSVNASTTFSGGQSLTLNGPGTLNGFNSLTVASGTTLTLGGAIGQSTPSILIKQGAGSLELKGANTFTGGAFLQAGTLRINNVTGSAFGTGAVTVGSGAILTGAGSFSGAVQLNGIFSPGNSPGTTSTGSQTWTGGAGYIWETNNAAGIIGTNTDLLSISGTLAISANSGNKFNVFLVSLDSGNNAGFAPNFNPASNYSFVFASTTSGISGFTPDAFALDLSGFQNPFTGAWSVAQIGNALALNYSASPIPEPSTYAAIAGVAALACAAWRRRKRGTVCLKSRGSTRSRS